MKKIIMGIMIFAWCCFASAKATKPFKTIEWTTKNGVHVIFHPAMEVPMLDVSIAFAAGSAYDKSHWGLSALTTRLLNEGSSGLDANTVAERLANTGAQYAGSNNQDMVVLSLKTLTEPQALTAAVDVFSSIVAHPNFAESVVLREKNQQLMAIDRALESPETVAYQTFLQVLYQKHPYAHPVMGTRETVAELTIGDVRHFYHQFFVGHNATMVLVGAIDEPSARRLVTRMTADLPAGRLAPVVPAATPTTGPMDIVVPFASAQTVVCLGQLGITHHDEDYFPLMVGNYILGGGSLVSQLAQELRESRGLTYGVSSQFSPMPGVGPFLINLSTKNNQAKTAIEVTRAVVSSFVKKGPSDNELLAAKRYLTGAYPLSLASNRSIADIMLKMAFYHLPDDYLVTYLSNVNAVQKKDIIRAFQQKILPNRWLQITVGTEPSYKKT